MNLAKPRGPTSHQVVASVRKGLGQRRVGHTGTLDPLAEGVLPIAIGRATRLAAALSDSPKTYYVQIQLGAATATDDAEGEVIDRWPVKDLSASNIQAAAARYLGEIQQIPPTYSAIKTRGRPAYEAARAGEPVALAPRWVRVYDIKLLGWENPRLSLLVRCSRGTYVRSLARDLGRELCGGGFVTRLVRISVGRFHLRWAISLTELEAAIASGSLEAALWQPDTALLDYPSLIVDQDRALNLKHGRPWPLSTALGSAPDGWVRAYGADGVFLGVVQADPVNSMWRPSLSFVT